MNGTNIYKNRQDIGLAWHIRSLIRSLAHSLIRTRHGFKCSPHTGGRFNWMVCCQEFQVLIINGLLFDNNFCNCFFCFCAYKIFEIYYVWNFVWIRLECWGAFEMFKCLNIQTKSMVWLFDCLNVWAFGMFLSRCHAIHSLTHSLSHASQSILISNFVGLPLSIRAWNMIFPIVVNGVFFRVRISSNIQQTLKQQFIIPNIRCVWLHKACA